MSTTSKSAFVLVPGSFSTPIWYDRVISLLTSKPHSVSADVIHGLTLPSTNHERAEGPATMYDDAAHVADVVTGFADKGYDVVVAMNSYAGFVGTEGCKNLSKALRTKEGKKGGVIALVYLAAFLPTVGQSVKELSGGLPGDEPYMSLEAMRSAQMARAIFPDLTDDEALGFFDKMTNHSRAAFDSTLTHESYKDEGIHVYYTYMLRDYILKTELQAQWIETAKAAGVNVDVVTLDGGHVPMIGHEKDVADLLVRAANAAK